MKKRVLLTLLEENEGLARQLGQELARAGLDVQAHFWNADLDRMAWGQAAKELASASVWVIAGQDFSGKDLRVGLALTALAAQAEHGNGFPVLISPGKALEAASLPDPLKGADIVKAGLGVKAAVQANSMKPLAPDYRLKPLPLNELGLWFELGPARDPWAGAFFACGSATREKALPNAHGVGKAGSIPERCTLHYPVEGMKLELRGLACEGRGVKNELTPADSYYVRVGACPEIIAFGAFPDTDEAELFTISLG